MTIFVIDDTLGAFVRLL